MICKNCGKKLNDNTTICPVCGKTTGATVKSQPVQPQQPHKVNSQTNDNTIPKRYCAKCGNAIAPDAKFCKHCGCDLNNSYKPQPNYSKPSDGRFAAIAIMKTNKKRNMIIATIAFLLVIIITILIMSLRPASSKIIGKWVPYAEEDTKGITYYTEEETNNVSVEFTKGGIIKIIEDDKSVSGSYSIEGDVLTITAYSSYWGTRC